MKKLTKYTKKDYKKRYFFMCHNNLSFIYTVIGPYDKKIYNREFHIMWSKLWKERDETYIISKLGMPNFRIAWDIYWFFELNGDTFCFNYNQYEGHRISIDMAENPDDEKKKIFYAFHPKEYKWQDDEKIKDKFIEFLRELDKYNI